jgi:nitrate reductase delta subunit
MQLLRQQAFGLLAEAFRYPHAGMAAALASAQAALPEGPIQEAYKAFVEQAARLSLGAWEELYTRTLDLNPPAAPYIGYQAWGDTYERGKFMAKLSRALSDAGVDASGELPDHLVPVLRYLGAAAEPLPELAEVFGPALERMSETLCKADPDNPYLHLLAASQALWQSLAKEAS